VIAVCLPIRTVSVLNLREHWSKRARRAAEHRALARMALAGPLRACPCVLPVQVTLTRVAPRELDVGDNLPASMKACRDSVADALGVDDRTPLVDWVYRQRRGKPREYAVEIQIESIST
jgi:hypothetical protein